MKQQCSWQWKKQIVHLQPFGRIMIAVSQSVLDQMIEDYYSKSKKDKEKLKVQSVSAVTPERITRTN